MEFVKTYDNVLTEEFCNKIIDLFNSDETNTRKGITAGGLNLNVKNTTDLVINQTNIEWTEIDQFLSSTLSKYLNIYKDEIKSIYDVFPYSTLQDTGFQIQKYNKNSGFYLQHHDFGNIIIENKAVYNRIITYLFYLNDVDEGGETEMLKTNKIKPKTGKLLIFPATWTYPHCGNMPISNDKYIVTGWGYGITSKHN